MLLSSWLKKLVQRTRGRSADGKLKKKPSPFTQLGLTRLEDRVVLTVNAMLVGTELQIMLPDNNDAATVEVAGTDIRVTGTGFAQTDFAAADVRNVAITAGVGTQTVSFDTAFSVLEDGIQATDGLLENLTFTGDITGVSSTGSIDLTVGQLDLGGSLSTPQSHY
jgi:type II secretory pathway component HofQ